MALRIENSDQDGSGPAAQCHLGANGTGCQADDGAAVPAPNSTFDRNSLDFNIDNPGFQKSETDFVTVTMNWHGDNGTWTNVFGKREYSLEVDLDVDARSISFFDAPGSSSMGFASEMRSIISWAMRVPAVITTVSLEKFLRRG